jgi:hypothetical protein
MRSIKWSEILGIARLGSLMANLGAASVGGSHGGWRRRSRVESIIAFV